MPTTPRTPKDGSSGRDDLYLAREALKGGQDAVDVFVERMRCIPRMLTSLNSRRNNYLSPDDIADLSQEVFTTVWKKLETYQGEAALETWVYSFCLLMMMNSVRKKARQPHAIEDDAPEPSAPVPDPSALTAPDEEAVHAALGKLGAAERSVVELKQFEALTFEDIAERLSISTNTAKTRYYRGLTKLRSLLPAGLNEDAR